jgi:cation diffusion facilitator family transporter
MHDHSQEPGFTRRGRYEAGRRVTLVSVTTNLSLTITQVVIGVLGNSQALVADAMHTLSDLVGDMMVLFALMHGRKEADEDHPYGHARIETAVTMLLGVILFAVGIGIAVRAGINLTTATTFVVPSTLAFWTAMLTLGAKEGMYHYTIRVARRFQSDMLRASAWHHRSDALSSLIVAAGIGGSLFGFGYLDSVAALIIALMIIKVGVELAWQAAKELVDTGLSLQDVEAIRATILAVGGVQALHELRTRRLGGRAIVDVHIIVDDRLSVTEGHQISDVVRSRVTGEHPLVSDAMVHIDTEEDIHGPACPDLPLRDEALQRLARLFRDIPEGKWIERTTLHYRDSRINLELLLPLATVSGPQQAETLRETFQRALGADTVFGDVRLLFR